MEILTTKFRYDPNARAPSAYVGVAPGGRTVVSIRQVDKNTDRMVTTRQYGAGIPRGQGGQVATIILGGMETSLAEIEYLLEGIREKKFVAKRSPADISRMCQAVAERRNEAIKHLRKNPSEASNLPKPKRRGLYLPKGYRLVQTPVPGFKIAVGG